MPLGTPFHPRTSALCVSMNWRIWAGYWAASSYGLLHQYEYHAVRSAAGLIDVSPLYNYEVSGKDALPFVDRLATRNAAKCAVNQAMYTCLCDEEGKVIQDGTIFRLEPNRFRFNLADPSLRWLELNAAGFDINIKDRSEEIATLALQGPTSKDILRRLVDFDIEELKFFRLRAGRVGDAPALISRTGYTGDLGYEIWVDAGAAVGLWDLLMEQGKPYGITPAGMLALDMARIEAGFILIEVDYMSVEKALIRSQKYSPFEIGLGWTVDLTKEHFVGRRALLKEKAQGSPRQLVGLVIDSERFEELHREKGLPAQPPAAAWRGGVPVYRDGRQVGKATSGVWSPILKKYIALATVASAHSAPEARLAMEVTVDHERRQVPATAAKLPFFDPPRKRA